MRRPSSPTRDGSLHIHQGSEWVTGTYHDGWHPVKRKHRGVTIPAGVDLHKRHLQEMAEEMKDKERAITAKFACACALCHQPIMLGDRIWWHPKTKEVRHRGWPCDSSSDKRSSSAATSAATPTTPQRGSEEAVAAIQKQVDEQTALLLGRVKEAEQQATIAREASEEAQEAIKQAEAKINASRKIEIIRTEADGRKKIRKLKAQHANFEKLVKKAAAGINVALVGDTGSGKTYAGRSLADALGLDFYHIPLGPQTSKSDLLGFISGTGKYIYSLLCQVYEHGGVGLLDEMDAANPATLTIVNGMLEAIEAGFADRMRKRHPDCVFVAAMNTYGRGADMLFVGRAQLDAATLNRWYYLDWNTDWNLARKIVKDDEWVNYVETLYESASRQKVRVAIGMRTAIMGKKAMQAGDTREEAEHGVIWAPIKPDDKQKILAGISEEALS